MKPAAAAAAGESSRGREVRYKGVRKRSWGKWVSEIRLPNSRERVWLGSYDSPEKAARAFDAAAVCLRGPAAEGLNFPDCAVDVPLQARRPVDHHAIRAIAARHALEGAAAVDAAAPGLDAASSASSSLLSDESSCRELAAEEAAALVEFPYDDFLHDFYCPQVAPAAAPYELEGNGGGEFEFEFGLWNF